MVNFPRFRMNDILDPDYETGGGYAQPITMADRIYQNFKVLKSRITYHIRSTCSANGGNQDNSTNLPCHFVAKLDNDGQWSPDPLNWTRCMIGNPRVKHKFGDISQKSGVRITQAYNVKKHWGDSIATNQSGLVGVFNGSGGGTGYPSALCISMLRIQSADFYAGLNATTLPNVIMDVTIDYVVELYNPRDTVVATGN